MCIFCGGQCGGVGELLISLGLPFLALYLSRIRGSLIKINRKIFPGGSGAAKNQDDVTTYRYCGEMLSAGYQKTGPVGFTARLNKPAPTSFTATKFNKPNKFEKPEGLQGVKGWLLLLCIILTIIIPASCLYEANCTFGLFNSTKNKILLFMFKGLLFYNLFIIISMIFLAVFSFYAGLRLWKVNPRAVKTAKAFLITQLSLIFLITITRPLIDFPLGGNGLIFGDLLQRLLPALFNFGLWYLYLSTSKRVHNTFSEAGCQRTRLKQYTPPLEANT